MTRKEAIGNLMHAIRWNDAPTKEALDMAIKAFKDKDVLDKIRAEIDEQYDRVHPYNISCAEGLEMALEIIDKYKAESEEV